MTDDTMTNLLSISKGQRIVNQELAELLRPKTSTDGGGSFKRFLMTLGGGDEGLNRCACGRKGCHLSKRQMQRGGMYASGICQLRTKANRRNK